MKLKREIMEMAGVLIEQAEPPKPPTPPYKPKDPDQPYKQKDAIQPYKPKEPTLPTKPEDEIETEKQKDLERIKKLEKNIQSKMALGEDISNEKRMIKEILLKWQKRKMPLINND